MIKNSELRSLNFATVLTNYAVEIRYPDDFYIPDIDEAKAAYEVALKVKDFVIWKINLSSYYPAVKALNKATHAKKKRGVD